MMTIVVLLYFAVAASYVAYGLPDGAPGQACITLTPEHGQAFTPRECPSSGCEFALFLSEIDNNQVPPDTMTYRCGANHTIQILQLNDSNPIRGVLIQARLATSVFNPVAPFIGELYPLNSDLQALDCDDLGFGLTHTNNNEKPAVKFSWLAPLADGIDVTFWFTVVVNSEEFYVQMSQTLIPDIDGCIQDEPLPPTVPPTVTQGNSFSLPIEPIISIEGTPLTLCVTKEGPPNEAQLVRVYTRDSGATSNIDYSELDIMLEFLPQEISKCFEIEIFNDSSNEETESFEVFIEVNSPNVISEPSSVLVVIFNNDCGADYYNCIFERFCIPKEHVCDGISDCITEVDEIMCGFGDPCVNEGEVRLSGGPTQFEGLVEICFEGTFKPIYFPGVELYEAVAVCKSLGYTGGGVWVNAFIEYGIVGQGDTLNIPVCSGNVTHPISCTPFSTIYTEHIEDVGIRCREVAECDHGTVRLVDGSSEAEGAVQLCVNGTWSFITSPWRFSEARVICKMLGHDEYGALPIPSLSISSRNDTIFSNSVSCTGDEMNITDCRIQYSNRVTFVNVNNNDHIVGVRCDDLPSRGCTDGDVRLIERESKLSGLVEVCVSGGWGLVCGEGWDDNEANVVCQQINSSDGSVAYTEGSDGQDIYHLQFPSCTGDESNLLECPIGSGQSKRGALTCFETGGVRCAEPPRILLIPPPTENETYFVEVGRTLEVRCELDYNLYYPGIVNTTVYRVINGDELMKIVESFGGSASVFDGTVQIEDEGTYMCIAEHSSGSSTQTININVVVPSGPRSRVFIYFSLPDVDERLEFSPEEIESISQLIEEELIYTFIELKITSGQQLVHCRPINRTMEDEKRSRDRFECVLDNYPPLVNDPTAVAELLVTYMDSLGFSFGGFNISVVGFCETDDVWPETEGGQTISLPCDDGIVTRVCSPNDDGAEWLTPDLDQCVIDFRCRFDSLSIPVEQVCDGVGHCLSLDDEINCFPIQTGCNDGSIRLSLGLSDNDGIVEICIDGAWGSLCESSFTNNDARVVCRQLDLPEGAVRLNNIQSLVPTHSLSLSCTGTENSILECGLIDQQQCDGLFSRAAVECRETVLCDDGELRLVDGRDSEQEGNLEICFNGVWGSVCENEREFSRREARVACTQLGYNPTGALVLPRGYLNNNRRAIPFITFLRCKGYEDYLLDCNTEGESGSISNNECDSFQIRCDDYPLENCEDGSVRLIYRVHTSEGTLEICIDGVWGILCADSQGYGENEAQVVCRQLGFSPNDPIYYTQLGSDGESMFHSDRVQCNGTEDSLKECTIESVQTGCVSPVSWYILCSREPSTYLSPPPVGSDDEYIFEVGGEVQVECRTERTYPQSNTTGYLIGNEPDEIMCESYYEQDFLIIDTENSAQSNITGKYQCLSCNDLGISRVNFTVTVLRPEGEGASAFLRISIPNIDRLSIFVNSTNLNDIQEDILEGLESLIAMTEVFEEEEGIQTVKCRKAASNPEDVEALRDRYECNITTYSSSDTVIQLVDRVAIELIRENVALLFSEVSTSDTGFCGYEVEQTEWGMYGWPETSGGSTAALTCVLDSTMIVRRECLVGGQWNRALYGTCRLLGIEGDINEDNLDETAQAVALAVQSADQTPDNAVIVLDVLLATADLIGNNRSLVDEMIVGNVTDVISNLQDWPEDALQVNNTGARIVESFEVITISLAQQENFTSLDIEEENIAVRIERIEIDEITSGRSLSVSDDEEGNLDATVGNDSGLAEDEIASGFLPLSLFQLIDSEDMFIPVVLAVFRTGSLFSIEGNQGENEDLETSVGSPVVSLTAGVNQTLKNLTDPVIVNVRILVENFTNPRCASYDFDQQLWVTDGCTTILTQHSNQITCECDHLTNFASLVDICTRTEEDGCGQNDDAKLALDIISIIGVILSGLGLILTILTLVVFKKLRNRDASKFHIQLSLALLAMLLVFAVGIDRTEVFEGCVTVSVLIHYFTLVAVMWMGAEALLMFQKLVIVFVQITKRQIIITSLICWLVPIIPAVIPAAIDADLVITDTDTNKFCFIGDARVFFSAFLGPIFAILLFNLIIFIVVLIVLIKHTRNKLGKTTDDKKQRKTNIRLTISLFGVMVLFGLTWVLGAFTISEASLAFQILFAIFNSLQGFFIFVFFCVLSSDVRGLWLEALTCGRYKQSKSSFTSGTKKSGLPRPKVNQSGLGTASSGLSAMPSSTTAFESESAFELSENPPSTFVGNDSIAPIEEKDHDALPQTHPTKDPEVEYKDPNTSEEKKKRKSGLIRGAFESMRVSIHFKN